MNFKTKTKIKKTLWIIAAILFIGSIFVFAKILLMISFIIILFSIPFLETEQDKKDKAREKLLNIQLIQK